MISDHDRRVAPVTDDVAPAIRLRHTLGTTDLVVATRTTYLEQPVMLRRPSHGTGTRDVVCQACGALVAIAVRSAAETRRVRLRWTVVFLAGLVGWVLCFLVRGPLGQGLGILAGLVAFVGGIALWISSGARIVGPSPGHSLRYGANGQPLHHFVMKAVAVALYGTAFLAGGLALDVLIVFYDGPEQRATAVIVIVFAVGLALIALGVWFGVQIATGVARRRTGAPMPVLLRGRGDRPVD